MKTLGESFNEWGIIQERKQVGVLYHFTTPDKMMDIITDGYILDPSAGIADRGQISFTRKHDLRFHSSSPLFQPDEEEINEMYGIKGDFTGDFADILAIVRIAIDGDKLSDKYKIQPYADVGPGQAFVRAGGTSEFEEIIPGNIPAKIYDSILRVDILDYNYEEHEDDTLRYQDAARPLVIKELQSDGVSVDLVSSWRPVK